MPGPVLPLQHQVGSRRGTFDMHDREGFVYTHGSSDRRELEA